MVPFCYLIRIITYVCVYPFGDDDDNDVGRQHCWRFSFCWTQSPYGHGRKREIMNERKRTTIYLDRTYAFCVCFVVICVYYFHHMASTKCRIHWLATYGYAFYAWKWIPCLLFTCTKAHVNCCAYGKIYVIHLIHTYMFAVWWWRDDEAKPVFFFSYLPEKNGAKCA